MPAKSEKTVRRMSGLRGMKKQISNKISDITERTQQSILAKFTDEQLAEFRDLFNMFDKDNQGVLTLQTIVTVMKMLGQTPTETDLIDLMREVDLDGSGTIDFYEFVHVISHRIHPDETNDEIRQAFNLFDKYQDGLISFEELKITVEQHLPMAINDIELHQMIELADRSGNGSVSFDDFLHAAVCRSDKKRSGMST